MGTPRPSYRYGGRSGRLLRLKEDPALLVVRTSSRRPLSHARLGGGAQSVLSAFEPVLRFPGAGVEVLRGRAARPRAQRDAARAALTGEHDVQFAGRVLIAPGSGLPVVYTENLFVKFEPDVKPTTRKRRLRAAGLTVKRELAYAPGSYFVGAPEGCGRDVFGIAAELLEDEKVELCHPELVRQRSFRGAAPQQWHLHRTTIDGNVIDQHASVVAAWALAEGDGVTIAVIDDGVDSDHEAFSGAGKVVHPRDVSRGVDSARPWFADDDHGTACAGVACANGHHGASGVAPRSRLMPIRLVSGLGSQDEADAFHWAATHGADVISCSWGPRDGRWWDPNDPTHDHVEPLPDSTRLAIDWAVNNGRNGKGCVITWAAGNGNESVDNDGYASYPSVIAVAACSDRGVKSVYSDVGDALWCSFPSSDFTDPRLTPGIWTTDRSGGSGYNPGSPTANGDAAGNYAQDFGGTSSACPGAAGVAALVIARNPELSWSEVKDVLRRCCDRIDVAGGAYDGDGHSLRYGFGRLNAHRAVELALPDQPGYSVLHEARQMVAIEDHRTSRLGVAVGDTTAVVDVKIHVEIEHSWIGDLVVAVKPPAGAAITLQSREGGSGDAIRKTFDTVTTPGLGGVVGSSPEGVWRLQVTDRAQRDVGRIVRFGVELWL